MKVKPNELLTYHWRGWGIIRGAPHGSQSAIRTAPSGRAITPACRTVRTVRLLLSTLLNTTVLLELLTLHVTCQRQLFWMPYFYTVQFHVNQLHIKN